MKDSAASSRGLSPEELATLERSVGIIERVVRDA